jgi:drug/metabolite transporter (DMT)-like permease
MRRPAVRYNEAVSPEKPSLSPASGAAHKPLHFRTFLMILVMILAGPFGNALLGLGMKHAGPLSLWPLPALLHTGLIVFSTPAIWCGIASLIAFFVSWMLALSWADYSFVRPASSLAYGIVALLGWLMLGEHVSLLRWAGIAVICMGVVVVGRTAPKTTGPKTTATSVAEPV